MNSNRNQIATGAPSPSPSSLSKNVLTTAAIAAAGFVLAVLMHGASSGDRSGYGMVVLGMTIFGSPFLLGAGALSFVFRRTVVGEFFGGACMFGAVFFGSLLLFG